jgi:hypothetical protein
MWSNMRLVRPIFLTLLAVSLATYAFDCGASAMTPEQALQCCNSMPCSSHGHDGQDCCKTMASMHAPFMQSSVRGASFSPLLFAVVPPSGQSPDLPPAAIIISADCHAPPVFSSFGLRPLRI